MQESYNVDNTYNVDSAPRTGESGERPTRVRARVGDATP